MADRERIQNDRPLVHSVAVGSGALWFSLPFLGAGIFVVLIGMRVVPVDPGSVHAPYEILTAVGAAFVVAGSWILVAGIRGALYRARRRRRQLWHPDDAWRIDWPWDEHGTRDRPWGLVARDWFGAGLLVLMLVPFVWWGFGTDSGPWMVRILTSLFGLVGIAAVFRACRRTLSALRYGASYLIYEQCPFRLGGELRARFGPCRSGSLRLSLECIEEYWETTGSGRNRSRRNVTDRLYLDERRLDVAANRAEIEVRFPLPHDPALSTDFSSERIRYWRVCAEARRPGIDATAELPVPVYAVERTVAVAETTGRRPAVMTHESGAKAVRS